MAAYKWPKVVILEDRMARQREQLEKRFDRGSNGLYYKYPYRGDNPAEDYYKRMADYHDTIIKWRKVRGLEV